MWGWTALLAVFGLLMVFMQGIFRWIMVVAAVALSAFVIARFHILRPTAVHGYDAALAKEAKAAAGEVEAPAAEGQVEEAVAPAVEGQAEEVVAPAVEGQAEDSTAGAEAPVSEEKA